MNRVQNEKFSETVNFIKNKIGFKPEIAVILGSGLGGFADRIENKIVIDYSEIPDFPVSTVEGHAGKLVFGTLKNKKIVIMKGRFHYYEGYEPSQISYPIQVFKELGVSILMVSNAAGGLNPTYKTGDLMLIKDYINLFPKSSVNSLNNNRLPAFDKELLDIAEQVARERKINLRQGIYIGSTGPTLETPAEYKMFRILGADATGMSTVPEIIAARNAGIRCFGISVITNESNIDKSIIQDTEPEKETTHEEVQTEAQKAEPNLTAVFEGVIEKSKF